MTVFIAIEIYLKHRRLVLWTLYTIIIYQTSIHPNRDFTMQFLSATQVGKCRLDIVTRAERPLDVDSKDWVWELNVTIFANYGRSPEFCNLDFCLTVMLYRKLYVSFVMIYFLLFFFYGIFLKTQLYFQNTAHDFHVVQGKMRKYRSQLVLQVTRSKNNFISCKLLSFHWQNHTFASVVGSFNPRNLVSFDTVAAPYCFTFTYYLLNLMLHSQ